MTTMNFAGNESGGMGGIGKKGWRIFAPNTQKAKPSNTRQILTRIFIPTPLSYL